jgi:hypothetical protein
MRSAIARLALAIEPAYEMKSGPCLLDSKDIPTPTVLFYPRPS